MSQLSIEYQQLTWYFRIQRLCHAYFLPIVDQHCMSFFCIANFFHHWFLKFTMHIAVLVHGASIFSHFFVLHIVCACTCINSRLMYKQCEAFHICIVNFWERNGPTMVKPTIRICVGLAQAHSN